MPEPDPTAGGVRRRLKVLAADAPAGGGQAGRRAQRGEPGYVNPSCVLVRRVGGGVYKSCGHCDLALGNCIQFRGQVMSGALVVLLAAGLFAPTPPLVKYACGVAMLVLVFWYLAYVSRESEKSILAVHQVRQREQHAEAAALALGAANAELDKSLRELNDVREKLVHADRMVAIGTLAAGVAHEINNPLSYVISNLSYVNRALAEEAPASPAPDAGRGGGGGGDRGLDELREALRDALEGAARVRQIVRHLRVVSRGDGSAERVIDVRRVLEACLEIATGWVKHRATVTRRIDPLIPLAVRAGEAQLGRVFLNILVNAVQSIPVDDGRAHEISVGARVEGERIVVEVRDDGVGIAPEHVHRIFEPFFTTKPLGEGTGLGLSIAHGIVRLYGGEISVESTPGTGSTFRVELPAAPVDKIERGADESGPLTSFYAGPPPGQHKH